MHIVLPFDVRLRKHLALAEETLWQRCVDKFITALPDIPPVQQPMVALMLPERPEIAEEVARRLLKQKNVQTVEWLKLVVQESFLLKALESYCAYDLLMTITMVASGMSPFCRSKGLPESLASPPMLMLIFVEVFSKRSITHKH